VPKVQPALLDHIPLAAWRGTACASAPGSQTLGSMGLQLDDEDDEVFDDEDFDEDANPDEDDEDFEEGDEEEEDGWQVASTLTS